MTISIHNLISSIYFHLSQFHTVIYSLPSTTLLVSILLFLQYINHSYIHHSIIIISNNHIISIIPFLSSILIIIHVIIIFPIPTLIPIHHILPSIIFSISHHHILSIYHSIDYSTPSTDWSDLSFTTSTTPSTTSITRSTTPSLWSYSDTTPI